MNARCRLFPLLALMALPVHAAVAAGPDPCAPAVAAQKVDIGVWTAAEIGPGWTPPACSGWTTPGMRSLVTVTGPVTIRGGARAILARFGAISSTIGVRFWSVLNKRWQNLLDSATALDDSGHPRPDFAAVEMLPGSSLLYREADSGAGSETYRMHIVAVSRTRVVLTIENASTIRFMLVPLFRPGDLQILFVLDRVGADEWVYKSLMRTAPTASSMTDGHEDSAVNRAVAMYRHIAGIPTDQEPPAAR